MKIAAVGAMGLAALLAAGCNRQAAQQTPVNQAIADALDDAPVANGAVDEQDAAPPAADSDGSVETVAVPKAAPAVPAAESAPLTEAAALSARIARDHHIQRVTHEGGWAWMENGSILRTASVDGKRVSYFRPGETEPYLVQQDDRAFAYADGKLARSYGHDGRPMQPDADSRGQAERLIAEARDDRSHAAADHPGPGDNDLARPMSFGDGLGPPPLPGDPGRTPPPSRPANR